MRAILLILIVAIVAIIVAIGSGLIDINQTRGARAPNVDAGGNGVTASGGQTPAFEVQTGTVKVQTAPATVQVPTLQVDPAGNDAQQVINNTAQ